MSLTRNEPRKLVNATLDMLWPEHPSHLSRQAWLAVHFHWAEGTPAGKNGGAVGLLIRLLCGALGLGGRVGQREDDGALRGIEFAFSPLS